MANQFLNDGEEKEVRSRPSDEPERHDDSHEDVAADETSAHADEAVTMQATPHRQRRSKSDHVEHVEHVTDSAIPAESRSAMPSEPSEPSEPVEPVESVESVEPATPESELLQLETLGFTEDEATRLIEVAERLNHSDEARDAEATLNRLQFTKWLIERGVLDEFSLRD